MNDQELRVQLLRSDLDHRFKEIQALKSVYHSQTKFLALVSGLTIGLVGLATGPRLAVQATPIAIAAGLVLIAAFLFYLASNLADLLFVIMVCGSRIKHIENQLNEIVGQTVLTWESEIVPRTYPNIRLTRFILLPATLVAVWAGVITLSIVLLLVFAWSSLIGPYSWVFGVLLLGAAIFQGLQWWGMLFHGGNIIDDIAYRETVNT